MAEPSRCAWAQKNSLLRDYHDREWGVPQYDSRRLFELLLLEGAQAGLSWATILAKREGYRRAFDRFDPHKIARYGAAKMKALMADPGIVRNRLKIEAAVANARACLELEAAGTSLAQLVWGFVDGKPVQNSWQRSEQVPASTPISDALGKELKRRGFRFVVRPSCTRSCRPQGWSTTTSLPVRATRRSRASKAAGCASRQAADPASSACGVRARA